MAYYESTDVFSEFTAMDVVGLLVAGLMQVGMWIWIIVLIVLDHRGFVYYWKPALRVAAILSLVALPVVAVDVALRSPTSPVLTPGVERMFVGIGGMIRIVVMGAWAWACYVVARWEWRHQRGRALARADGLGLGLLAGLVIGSLSMALFYALEVKESALLMMIIEQYGAMHEMPRAALLIWTMLFALHAAAFEELEFRGVLFGFLMRVMGTAGWAIVLTHLIVGLMFALMHLPNTDAPLIKCGQIFVLAVVCGELARRYSVAAAVTCHASMNAVAVVVAFMLEME